MFCLPFAQTGEKARKAQSCLEMIRFTKSTRLVKKCNFYKKGQKKGQKSKKSKKSKKSPVLLAPAMG
jgi:hypothetical protein